MFPFTFLPISPSSFFLSQPLFPSVIFPPSSFPISFSLTLVSFFSFTLLPETSQTPQSSVNPNGNQGLNVWQLYLQTLANNPNPSRAAPSSSPSINPTTNPFAQPQGGQPNIHPHYSSSNAGNYPNPAPNPTPYDAYPGSYSQRPSSNPNPQSYPYANTNPNWNPYPNSNSNGNPYPPGTFARNQPSNPNQTDPLTQLVNQMGMCQPLALLPFFSFPTFVSFLFLVFLYFIRLLVHRPFICLFHSNSDSHSNHSQRNSN